MTIGFHYHIPATKKDDGLIYVPGYLGVFIDGLAKEVQALILYLHTPLIHELDHMDYALKGKNITLVSVGPHSSFYKRILNRKAVISAIENDKRKLNLILVRGPSPLLPFIAAKCKKLDISYAYLLVGDYLKTLKGADKLGVIKRSVLGLYYFLNKYFQDKYSKHALVFANNKVIYDEYQVFHPQSYLIKTTTLNADDFFYREDTCNAEVINLIYAGRIEPTKGMDDVLDAIDKLQDNRIVLNLVGWDPSVNDAHLSYLLNKAASLGLSQQLVFHGKKKVGNELLSMYRESDIFILATKGNEGFPRTIWEAMASSMPVIATKVGSIPIILENDKHACLIDEGSAEQIALKIKELLQDPILRKRLIQYGLGLAKENTNEIQASKMREIMNNYLEEN